MRRGTLGPGRQGSVSAPATQAQSPSLCPLVARAQTAVESGLCCSLAPGGAGMLTDGFYFCLSVSPQKWDCSRPPRYRTDCWEPGVTDRDREALCEPHGGPQTEDSSWPTFSCLLHRPPTVCQPQAPDFTRPTVLNPSSGSSFGETVLKLCFSGLLNYYYGNNIIFFFFFF